MLATSAVAAIGAIVAARICGRFRNDAFNGETVPRVLANIRTHGGEVVFDESNGTPRRLFQIDQQNHGALGIAVQLANGNVDCVDDFLGHHDALTEGALRLIRELGPDRVRVFIEGFVGPPEEWDADTHIWLRALAETEELRERRPQSMETLHRAALEQAMERIHRGDIQAAASVLRSCQTTNRLAATCLYTHPEWRETVIGINTHDMEAVAREGLQRVRQLIVADVLTDHAVRGFCDWHYQVMVRDHQRLHMGIASAICAHVVPGMVGKAIIGSAHTTHGEGGVPYDTHVVQPLEWHLSQVSDSRTLVVQPKKLLRLDTLVQQDELAAQVEQYQRIDPDNLLTVLLAYRRPARDDQDVPEGPPVPN